MKYILTQAEYDALSDAMKALYKEQDGKFVLTVEGLPTSEEAAELKRAKEHEKNARIAAEKKAKELEDAAQLQRDELARRTGDIATIEDSWKTKHQAAIDAGNETASKLKTRLTNLLVNDVANAVAARLAGKSAAIILPHIKQRLKAEFDGDDAITRVLDVNGKASALSVAELEQEFRTNPDFASIIIGSKASGSGASGNAGGGASKKLSEMNDAERKAYKEADPEGFKRESNQHKAF